MGRSFIAFIFILSVAIYALNFSNYLVTLSKGVKKQTELNSRYNSNMEYISIFPYLINKSKTGSFTEIDSRLSSLRSNTLDIELIELSSKINPNFVDFTIFKEPYLKALLKNQYTWRDLYKFRSEKGLLQDITPYYKFFKEDADCLTYYNLPNINNISDDSLERVYSFYTGDEARGTYLRERVVQNRKNGTTIDEKGYRSLLGSFDSSIANIVTITPTWNVNYVKNDILRALITKKYKDKHISGFIQKRETLLKLREKEYITQDKIESILQLNNNQKSVITYLGDRSTFYLIKVINKKANTSTELIFKWNSDKYELISLITTPL